MKKNRILNGIMLVLALLIGVSVVQIWRIVRDYRQGEKTYAALAQYAQIPDTSAGAEDAAPPPHTAAKATAESAEEDGDWPQVDFEALRNINPDVIGWIYIGRISTIRSFREKRTMITCGVCLTGHPITQAAFFWTADAVRH